MPSCIVQVSLLRSQQRCHAGTLGFPTIHTCAQSCRVGSLEMLVIPISHGCEDHSFQKVVCVSIGPDGVWGEKQMMQRVLWILLQQTHFEMVSEDWSERFTQKSGEPRWSQANREEKDGGGRCRQQNSTDDMTFSLQWNQTWEEVLTLTHHRQLVCRLLCATCKKQDSASWTRFK